MKLADTRLKDVLVSAFEGGSNYWYKIVGYNFPAGVNLADFREGGQFTDPDNYLHPDEIIPATEGCSTLIADKFGDRTVRIWLNRQALDEAFRLLQQKYPHHAADILTENDDAISADVLLQLAVYGEVVYG